MKTVGIVAEYDPFHSGHQYQMRRAVEVTGADCVVVVLGGDFLQRGMPGLFSKEIRARMAVDAGADLVVQLPHIYACNSGSEYAAGAVGILDGLGCVEALSFGAEADDPALLAQAASVDLEEPEATALLHTFLDRGVSYPEAVTGVVERLAGAQAAQVLRRPNNLLAVEYLRAMRKAGSRMKPVPVRRTAALPSEEETGCLARALGRAQSPVSDAAPGRPVAGGEGGEASVASASDLRRLLRQGCLKGALPHLPASTVPYVRQRRQPAEAPVEQAMRQLLLYRLTTSDPEQLAAVYGVSEGLEHRLLRAAASAPESLEALVAAVRAKRYTEARIRRVLLHVLLDLQAEDFAALRGTAYARVLGFSDKGAALLRRASKTASIPVLSNLHRVDQYDPAVQRCLALDNRAAALYRMLHGAYGGADAERRYVPYRKTKPFSAD